MSECQNCSPWYSCDECNQKFAERRSVDPMTKAEQPTITQALKPCPNPWCTDNTAISLTNRGDCYANGFLVYCRSCGIEGPYVAVVAKTSIPVKDALEAEAEAIAAWNTRTSLAAQDGLVEALARSLCDADEPRIIADTMLDPDFENSYPHVKDYWRAVAKAALASIEVKP